MSWTCIFKHSWIYSDYERDGNEQNTNNIGTYYTRYCRLCRKVQHNKPTYYYDGKKPNHIFTRVQDKWYTTGFLKKKVKR